MKTKTKTLWVVGTLVFLAAVVGICYVLFRSPEAEIIEGILI